MGRMDFLPRREVKKIVEAAKKQWGYSGDLDYVFLRNTRNRLYLVNKDIAQIDEKKLRIDSIGMYFGELCTDGLRLSIEGSQLIGPECSKGIIDVSRDDLNKWLLGEDLIGDGVGYVLIRCDNGFAGCGRYHKGKITNFVNKNRRINAIVE